jgi:hypothetical protein
MLFPVGGKNSSWSACFGEQKPVVAVTKKHFVLQVIFVI